MKTWSRLAACALIALLAACAGNGGGASGKQDLPTASDQTAVQKRAAIRMELAVGYYSRGQYEVALDEVKQAIAVDPANPDAYGMRALIYMALREHELAEDSFRHALKLAPQNPELSNNYGSFLCQNGRAAEAIPYFDGALNSRNYQTPLPALNNAGSCSIKLKDYARAERYLLEALRIDPNIPQTNANLARVYFERRDLQRAGFFINRLRETAKLDGVGADVLWLAIRIVRKLGDRDAETALVTQLKRHYPNSTEFAAFQRGAFEE